MLIRDKITEIFSVLWTIFARNLLSNTKIVQWRCRKAKSSSCCSSTYTLFKDF
jgi:hypothetical protein